MRVRVGLKNGPFRIWHVFFVVQHRVARYPDGVSGNVQVVEPDSVGHVVVFPAPAPEHVGKTVE